MASLGFMMQHHEKNTNCFVCKHSQPLEFSTQPWISRKDSQRTSEARALTMSLCSNGEGGVNNLGKGFGYKEDADAMAAQSAGMVEDVETVMGLVESMEVVAAKAKEMAEKAAEMVKEANDTTETAKREMAKALGVMRKVKWNV
ncbi:hypothetical protein HID58_091496 [Brassica napus]|uniref:Uncharacterized protein n=1 Tax=Brassica napus TaxID=3708 RepID=A0ABQ7X032_BRANA|nr:hypothetical protein HID58_091496 [Brassica napus]